MKATHLQTEYLTEPLGLGIINPRFYWNCEGGIKQTAYRVTALRKGETIWDSGKVQSCSMTHICYDGAPLRSRDRVEWFVTLWDENSLEGEQTSSWFEMGLLEQTDWTAKWIAGDYEPKRATRFPVDCFLKEFSVSKKIKKARMYTSACGLYEAKLNGKRVGDFILAPGCTDYRKRIQYQTYDVAGLITEQNTLEVQLGDGWYRGSINAFGQMAVFGHQTKLLCQLELTYTDESIETIGSDKTWRWSNDGPIRFADLKDGERFDASMRPTFSKTAMEVTERIIPTASNNVPVREKEHFTATVSIAPSGKRIYDFGQNMAGYLSFVAEGKKGDSVLLRFGETLDNNGELTQRNFQLKRPVREWGKLKEVIISTGMGDKLLRGPMQDTPLQQILFLCSGGNDTYKTTFAVFGFRYCEVSMEAGVSLDQVEAIAVYSDMEQVGNFHCSHEGVNKLLANTRWSMKSNFLDIPTDCPTRERLGWTGDAQVFFRTGAYLMNTAPFFAKWLVDMDEGRMKNGVDPAVIPFAGNSLMYDNIGASVGWADAMVLIPYRYWKCFGDEAILRKYYEMMRGYAMFVIKHAGHKSKKDAKQNPYHEFVYEKGRHLGEWLEPGDFQETGYDSNKPHPEEATAYMHLTLCCMAEIAGTLGNVEDAELFRKYAEGSQKAYNWMFLRNGVPDTDRQAKLVRPLAFGLFSDEKTKQALKDRLAQAVINNDFCISTGFLSTAFILPVLSDIGRSDLAYGILENTKCPGWMYQIEHGATTTWEEWEAKQGAFGTGSLNHYSPGAVCEWLFSTVAGIRVTGENHFRIMPVPGGSLTFAEANYRSIYGEVSSRWEKTPEGISYQITIPANTTAEIILSDGTRQIVTSGTYRWLKSWGDSKECTAV